MAQFYPELILLEDDKVQLSSWIGKPCNFELLYKIKRDGLSTQTFHKLCDNKGPTVTVLINSIGNVFGGYLSKSWSSNNIWIKDEKAFLFQLRRQNQINALKLNVQTPEHAACGVQSWGPAFGCKYFQDVPQFDLLTFFWDPSQCAPQWGFPVGNQQYFHLNGHESQISCYTHYFSLSEGHFQVEDLEVYLVNVLQPWREMSSWDLQTFTELKNHALSYVPLKKVEVPEANILLVGQVGAGKSSLLNTFNSIFKGEITSRAWAGSSEHSLTIRFNKFQIRDSSKEKNLNFRLCDTRGFEENLCIKHEDIMFILDGNLPNNYRFNPVAQASSDTPGFKRQPTLKDKIHVVVFVIDGSSFEVMSDGILQKFKETKNLAIERGVPLLVYVTKIDKICNQVDNDVKYVFYSKPIKDIVNKIADGIGIPRTQVLPVKNYEKEDCLKTSINILALKALLKTLRFAEDFLENQCELQQETEQLSRLNIRD